MPTGYVILHHQLTGSEHWDLMLERGDVLITWQLSAEPDQPASLPIAARRIGDHRIAYLTYEGPVSGNRGTVRRVDSGTVEFEEFTDGECIFSLRAGRLEGQFRLARGSGGWVLSCATGKPADGPHAAGGASS